MSDAATVKGTSLPTSESTAVESAENSNDTDPLLVGENLTKDFGGLLALDDVDVQVHETEILGLIGPNGAGKTTLFNCMSGVYPPRSGSVRLHGDSITDWKPHRIARHGLARTFQISRPIEELTVRENVMIGAHIRTRRRSKAAMIASETLDWLDMSDLADRTAAELTIGRQKIMELGRVVAMDPDVLFVDEMMAGLTPAETDELLEHLREIRDRGIALFVIEHDMRAIMDISDRVIVLDQGQKIADGPPDQVANDRDVIEVYLGDSTRAPSGDGPPHESDNA
jgi:branched-chain amino acid transport system ATP-binding protein